MKLRSTILSSKNLQVKADKLMNILTELNKADKSNTRVGFPFDGDVKAPSQKGSGKEKSDSIHEIATIAFFNEFGTRDVPERPFMSTAFEENKEDIHIFASKLYGRIIDGALTTEKALGLLGEFHVMQIKHKIRSIMTPPNAPSTIARKKDDNPLIDTAQMLNSIQHVENIDV